MYGDPVPNRQFKSANTFAMAIWEPTAKFNSRQYFRLYGTYFSIPYQRGGYKWIKPWYMIYYGWTQNYANIKHRLTVIQQ